MTPDSVVLPLKETGDTSIDLFYTVQTTTHTPLSICFSQLLRLLTELSLNHRLEFVIMHIIKPRVFTKRIHDCFWTFSKRKLEIAP